MQGYGGAQQLCGARGCSPAHAGHTVCQAWQHACPLPELHGSVLATALPSGPFPRAPSLVRTRACLAAGRAAAEELGPRGSRPGAARGRSVRGSVRGSRRRSSSRRPGVGLGLGLGLGAGRERAGRCLLLRHVDLKGARQGRAGGRPAGRGLGDGRGQGRGRGPVLTGALRVPPPCRCRYRVPGFQPAACRKAGRTWQTPAAKRNGGRGRLASGTGPRARRGA